MKFSRMKTFLVIFVLSMGSTGLANTSIEHSALVSGVRFSADGTKLMLWTEGDSEGDLTVRDILSGQDQIFKTGEIISGGDETGFCYANQVICLDNGFSFTFVNLKNEKQYHLWGDPIISANGRYVMGVDGYYGSELHVLDLETDTKTQIQFNGRDKFSFSPLSTKMMLVSDATESLVVDLSTGDEKIFPVWNSHFNAQQLFVVN